MADGGHDAAANARLVKRNQGAADRARISVRDFVVMAVLGFGAPIAAILPDKLVIALCRLASRIWPDSPPVAEKRAKIASSTGVWHDNAEDIVREQRAAQIASTAFLFKDMLLGRAYKIETEGIHHVTEALAKGHGAVAWIADLVYASDAGRQALSNAGYPPTHMSRPEHGFSHTQFGIKYLNPLRVRTEDKYVHKRVIYRRESGRAALQALGDRLNENGVISLLACADEGHSLVEVPVLGGHFNIAVGALKMGMRAGCPVLPVFCLPAPEPPYFKVRIGAPLPLDGEDRDQAILTAALRFAEDLNVIVQDAPHLWRGWATWRKDP